jgi:hypothetical protein
MLSIAHTYVLDQALKDAYKNAYEPERFLEAFFGNIFPDYADYLAYLSDHEDHKKAHDLPRLKIYEEEVGLNGFIEHGIKFHMMTDNQSFIGRATYVGDYPKDEDEGFVSELSKEVNSNLPSYFPKRRVIQCGLDIKILEDDGRKERMKKILYTTNEFVSHNYEKILERLNRIYPDIGNETIEFGLKMFTDTYRMENAEIYTNPLYRLRCILKELDFIKGTEAPDEVLAIIKENKEVQRIMENNIHLLDGWKNHLDIVKKRVMEEMQNTQLFSANVQVL